MDLEFDVWGSGRVGVQGVGIRISWCRAWAFEGSA